MASKALPSPEVLRQLLRYEPSTGKLFWNERWTEKPNRHTLTWNTRYAGSEAFTYTMRSGYKQGAIHHVSLLAHRVVMAVFWGQWPDEDVDHINGDKSDNRIENLRLATRSENNKNRRAQPNKSSRFLGVSWSKQAQKWEARIATQAGQKFLGNYTCESAAASAYDAAAIKYHGEFARPNFP